jgi:hypothetical protein
VVRRWAVPLTILAAALLLLAVVVFEATDWGTVRITVNEPEPEVRIDGRVVGVEIVTSYGLALRAGNHLLEVGHGGLPVETRKFSVRRGKVEDLQVDVPPPMVASVALDYDFPAYTGVPRRANVAGANVEAIEGTLVTVHAQTNVPARFGEIHPKEGDSVPMEVLPTNPRELIGKFRVKNSGTYTIKVRSNGGQSNPDPVVYDIVALPDRPPTARFDEPDRPLVKVPSNVKVALRMAASDDHGIRVATLHVRKGSDRPLVSENLVNEKKPPTGRFLASRTLDLEALKVKLGDRLEYWLIVRDTKEPLSNRVESVHQVIEVIAPVTPEEKSKIENGTSWPRIIVPPGSAGLSDID